MSGNFISGGGSIRAFRVFNYSRPGAYFITICTHDRGCLFGEVVDGVMESNVYGRIVADEWYRTATVRSNVVLDAFVVMPNHIHGIIVIVESDDGVDAAERGDMAQRRRGTPAVCPYTPPPAFTDPPTSTDRTFGGAVAGSLSTIMRQYKSVVTKRINQHRHTPGAPVWQRGFYEHIIRNERALNQIRRYIINNPMQWRRDRNRPG